MIKFFNIKRLGRKPKPVRSAEEAEERIKEMRSWSKGPINTAISWLVQVFIFAIPSNIFLRVFNRVKIIGYPRLKAIKLPYMLVSNHLTLVDDTFIDSLLYLPLSILRIKYLPWHAPEEQNFFLGPIFTWIFKKARCVPLTRGHGVFQPGMSRLKELLLGENIVHIFPEGTRSRSGDITSGKVGVGRLAFQTKTKVVPCYHEGIQEILPIGSHLPRIGRKVSIIVGDPIDMSDLYRLKEGRETYQKIADRMIEAIVTLRNELHEGG